MSILSQTQISFSTSQSVGRNFQQGDQIAIGVNFGVNTRQKFEIDTLQIQFDLRANAGYLYTELSSGSMFSARDTLSQWHLWAADANIGKNDIAIANLKSFPHYRWGVQIIC
jgi:hypothetical protein